MAGVYSKAKIQPDLEIVCCLGNHPLNNPKLLPCYHSFCTDCIKTKVRPDKKEFTCPKCQLTIPLTETGVEQLPDDVLFHILQESKAGNAECVMCKYEDKKSRGTFQCLDCGEIMCDECKGGHTKSAITRLHRVVSLYEIKDGKYKSEVQTAKQIICDTHSKSSAPMVLKYYCEQCTTLLCEVCAIEEHALQGHVCKNIKDIYCMKIKATEGQVVKLAAVKQLDEKYAVVLEGGQTQDMEELEKKVYHRAAQIIEVIEKIKVDKLDEIRGILQEGDASIQSTLNETKNRIIRIDRLVNYTDALIEHSAKSEFLQHENGMMKTLTKYVKEKRERRMKIDFIELGDLQIETLEDYLTQAFGEIRIKKKVLSIPGGIDVPRDWMKEPEVLFSVPSGIGQAWGLTVTENGDIVAVHGLTIQVYDSEGKPKERIGCSRIQKSWNVVAKDDTLYVSTRSTREPIGTVLGIDLQGNLKETITLPEDCTKIGLAIDDEGNIVMSSNRTHCIYKCEANETKAEIFIPPGTHPDLKGPLFLCVTYSGEVVISNNDSHTVLAYSRDGDFLWQYKGQGERKLNSPRGVCCDMYGYIYIANLYGNCIEVIRNGVFQESIKIQELTYPYGITLDNDGNIVCSYKDAFSLMKIRVWRDDP